MVNTPCRCCGERGLGPLLDGSLSSGGQATDDCQLNQVYQQSLGTLLVSIPHRTPNAGVRGSVYQYSHPEDRVLWPVTYSGGHQAPSSKELEVPSNSHAKTVSTGSGPLAQWTDKAGCATLAQEPMSNLPELDWVGPY